jgi:hypothetical protein
MHFLVLVLCPGQHLCYCCAQHTNLVVMSATAQAGSTVSHTHPSPPHPCLTCQRSCACSAASSLMLACPACTSSSLSRTLMLRHKRTTSESPCAGAEGVDGSNQAYMQGESCAQEPKSIFYLHWYNGRLTCAQEPNRLRWGTGSARRPLFIHGHGARMMQCVQHTISQQHRRMHRRRGAGTGQA